MIVYMVAGLTVEYQQVHVSHFYDAQKILKITVSKDKKKSRKTTPQLALYAYYPNLNF